MPVRLQRLFMALLAVAVGLIALSFIVPADYQLIVALALFGLFVLVQAVILWNIWQRNPALRQARRRYMAGDFAEVVRILEASRAEGRHDVEADTLLGNAFRQLGDLERSEAILREACEKEPDAPFAAYGLGRTLLVMGHYNDAAALIAHALDQRGQPVILAELGHAQYRAGERDEAARSLAQAAQLNLEPYRALMTRYLLWKLTGKPVDDETQDGLTRFASGLDVWRAEADRFAVTPYGQALAEDVHDLELLLDGGK